MLKHLYCAHGAGKVAKEADRVTHVKRIDLEIDSIKKKIEDYCNKLGEMAYKSSVNNEPETLRRRV